MSTNPIQPDKLTPEEAARLARCESVVRKGIQTFKETGEALLEIKEGKLYRETHPTFKDYVEQTWRITARRAYQLCEAAEVVKALPDNVNRGSQINERQARELAKADPEDRAAVLDEVAAEGPVTAKAIKAKVAKHEIEKGNDTPDTPAGNATLPEPAQDLEEAISSNVRRLRAIADELEGFEANYLSISYRLVLIVEWINKNLSD